MFLFGVAAPVPSVSPPPSPIISFRKSVRAAASLPAQIPLHFALPSFPPSLLPSFRSFSSFGRRDFKQEDERRVGIERTTTTTTTTRGEKEAIELRSRKSQTPIQRGKKTRATFENASATKISFHLRQSHSGRLINYKYEVGGKGGVRFRNILSMRHDSGTNMRSGGVVLNSLAYAHRPRLRRSIGPLPSCFSAAPTWPREF